jgi:hypothetical protein
MVCGRRNVRHMGGDLVDLVGMAPRVGMVAGCDTSVEELLVVDNGRLVLGQEEAGHDSTAEEGK